MVHKTLIKHVRREEEKKTYLELRSRDVETSPPNLLHIQEGRVSFGGGGESCEKLTSST